MRLQVRGDHEPHGPGTVSERAERGAVAEPASGETERLAQSIARRNREGGGRGE